MELISPEGARLRSAHFDPEVLIGLGSIGATLVGAFGAVWYQARTGARRSRLDGPDQALVPSAVVTLPTPDVVRGHLEEVLSSGVLRVGAVKHPPLSDFCYHDSRYTFDGYYVRLAMAAADLGRLRVDFKPIDWSDVIGAFEGGEVDLVVSVFETRARAAYADFVAPFHTVGLCGLALASNESVSDLRSLISQEFTIAVTRGEAGWELARDLRIPKRRLTVLQNSDLSALVAQVEMGHADIVIVDEVTAVRAVRARPNLKTVLQTNSLGICRNSIMVPKGDIEFGNWVDELFTRARELSSSLKQDEDRILDEWHGVIRRFR